MGISPPRRGGRQRKFKTLCDEELAGRSRVGCLVVSAREDRCLQKRPSFAYRRGTAAFLIIAENGIPSSTLGTPFELTDNTTGQTRSRDPRG